MASFLGKILVIWINRDLLYLYKLHYYDLIFFLAINKMMFNQVKARELAPLNENNNNNKRFIMNGTKQFFCYSKFKIQNTITKVF